MSNNIFDLEQQIQDCWKVTDDIDLITKHLALINDMGDRKWIIRK